MRMKCLYMSFIFFAYNYMIWGQNLSFPTSEGIVIHVSSDNSTIERISKVNAKLDCPKDMILYPIKDGENDTSICDCIPRFLYFPSNDSCHEAYRQGPCPPENYVVLPEDEEIPRCVENPCLKDGMVPYNGTCYSLNTIDGPCASQGAIIGVNETTFQLDCIQIVVLTFIDVPSRTCPKGTRRSIQGECKKV